MAFEIEHKFLVKDKGYMDMADFYVEIKQGYLCKEPERTVRVRTWDKKGFLTVKGLTVGDKRCEYEYEIPYDDAVEMLGMCKGDMLEKRRYILKYEGFKWEVDEFHGKREGLVLAEIELPSGDTPYKIPPFVGENVTGNPTYYNSNL